MPDKTGRFTPQEAVYIEEMVATGDGKRSAAAAGYKAPAVSAVQLAKRPEVQAAIFEAVQARLNTEGAAVALRVLVEIAGDEKAPKAPRVAAARTLAEMSGLGAAGAGASDKPPSEMTRAELVEARERALAVLASLEAPRIIEHLAPEADPASVSALFD